MPWGTLTGMTQPGILAIPIASVPRLPPEWVNLFGLAWIISALAFAAGWPRRLSGLVLSGILAYTLVLDQQTYTNHLYLFGAGRWFHHARSVAAAGRSGAGMAGVPAQVAADRHVHICSHLED